MRTTASSSNLVKGPDLLNVRATETPGPKFSLRGKFYNKGKTDADFYPSPGTYYREEQFGGRNGVRFGTSKRDEVNFQKINEPSPGEYFIDRSIGLRGTKMGKGKRRPPTDVDPDIEVGPNTYELKSTVPQLQYHEDKAMKENAFKLALD